MHAIITQLFLDLFNASIGKILFAVDAFELLTCYVYYTTFQILQLNSASYRTQMKLRILAFIYIKVGGMVQKPDSAVSQIGKFEGVSVDLSWTLDKLLF